MGRRMGEKQSNQEDKELVLVAFEGEIASLETLVRLAREYGFRKVLSSLVKDLQKAQAETIEIIAIAADNAARSPDGSPALR
jgi:ferritin-like metal-binding protein YciE